MRVINKETQKEPLKELPVLNKKEKSRATGEEKTSNREKVKIRNSKLDSDINWKGSSKRGQSNIKIIKKNNNIKCVDGEERDTNCKSKKSASSYSVFGMADQ